MGVIANFQQVIDLELKRISIERRPKGLYDPIRYVLGIGGKRIRPALCMAFCHYYCGTGKIALNAALGLEVFHNFTLLHDDIMDNAPIRRNLPTVHEKWNANTAILSGDAMMIVASQKMLDVPVECLIKVQQTYLQTALEVCEGQQYDMEFENSSAVSVDDYLEMIRLKTAVLIAAAMKIGALIGGAHEKEADMAYRFGQNLGLAFQLQDDYLDVFGNEKEFGKSIGGDIVANKKTYMLLSCLETANDQQRKVLDAWLQKTDFVRDEKIAAIKALFVETGIKERCRQKMNDYYNMAMSQLAMLNIDKTGKDELAIFAENLINRER